MKCWLFKFWLLSLLLLPAWFDGARAADADKIERARHVAVDCSSFAKRGVNWIAVKDTKIAITIRGRGSSAVQLPAGTSATNFPTYGITLEDVLQVKCPQRAPAGKTAEAPVAQPVNMSREERKPRRTSFRHRASGSSWDGRIGY